MQTQPDRLINLTPANLRFYDDLHRFIVCSASRRSRKTIIGDRKILTDPGRGAMVTPDHAYYLLAPTHRQAKKIYWDRLKRNTRYFWAKRASETDLTVFLKNGSMVSVDGLDKPERIEGQTDPPIKGVHITEVGNTKPDFWNYHIRPILSDTNGFAILEGVPEGRNHYYKMALYAAGGIIPDTLPMLGAYGKNLDDEEWSFHSWYSSDVLPEKEITAMRLQMDERSFRQELEGEFVSYEGYLYYTFSDENVNAEKAKRDPDNPLYLTCDFNKSPMVWEVNQVYFDNGLKCLKTVGEMSMSFNAKTEALATKFVTDYSDHRKKLVYLTGDASGNYESQKDHTTDYQLTSDVLIGGGWNVLPEIAPTNPSINNRVNVFCSMIKNISGKIRYYVHPDCKYLINDLRSNEGDGKGAKDKTDPEQTHGSDAQDYLVWLLFKNEFFNA